MVDLGSRFAHAGKDDPADGLGRSGQHPLQFAAGDDVEARAMVRKQIQNGQCGVRLYCITDQVVPASQRLLKHSQPLDDMVARVNIKRCAVTLRQRFQRNFAAVQSTAWLRMMKRARR